MANQPPFPAEAPPPILPSLPEASPTLVNYLRNFSLWCRNGFRAKLDAGSAAPGILMQSYDSVGNPTGVSYMVRVTVTGTAPAYTPSLTMTQILTGSGKP